MRCGEGDDENVSLKMWMSDSEDKDRAIIGWAWRMCPITVGEGTGSHQAVRRSGKHPVRTRECLNDAGVQLFPEMFGRDRGGSGVSARWVSGRWLWVSGWSGTPLPRSRQEHQGHEQGGGEIGSESAVGTRRGE